MQARKTHKGRGKKKRKTHKVREVKKKMEESQKVMTGGEEISFVRLKQQQQQKKKTKKKIW